MTNDSKTELRIADVHEVACPTCGRAVTGYETNQPVKYRTEPVELWEGGPVIETQPRHFNEQVPDGPPITTLNPCGHHVHRIVWTKEALSQRARGSEWGGGKDE